MALGVTYKPNTYDTRNSPALKIINLLREDGYQVAAYDPLAEGYHYTSITEVAQEADCLAVLVEHQVIKEELVRQESAIKKAMRHPVALNITELISPDNLIAFDQFSNSRLKGNIWLKSGGFNLGIADDVVSFIRVFANFRLNKIEVGDLLPNLFTEFPLTNVSITQTNIIGRIFHLIKILQAVDKGFSHIPNMDKVSLEMSFKKDNKAVGNGAIGKIVNQ